MPPTSDTYQTYAYVCMYVVVVVVVAVIAKVKPPWQGYSKTSTPLTMVMSSTSDTYL